METKRTPEEIFDDHEDIKDMYNQDAFNEEEIMRAPYNTNEAVAHLTRSSKDIGLRARTLLSGSRKLDEKEAALLQRRALRGVRMSH